MYNHHPPPPPPRFWIHFLSLGLFQNRLIFQIQHILTKCSLFYGYKKNTNVVSWRKTKRVSLYYITRIGLYLFLRIARICLHFVKTKFERKIEGEIFGCSDINENWQKIT